MKAIKAGTLAEAVGGKILSGNKDLLITSVSTNSKEIQQGDLFVPIIGERVDAHNFIDMALEAGAVATFTQKEIKTYKEEKVYIQVADTLHALQLAAAYYRSQFSIPLIGITGSVGKTTTKEMIAAALSTKKKVLKTKGNMNSQVGLPLMMFELEEEMEVAVIEMGMSEVGEMHRLSIVAKPDMAVMTNIGVSHIGQLGSRENIRKEKLNIIDEFSGGNPVYVNGDDPLLGEIKEYVDKRKKGEEVPEELFDEDTYEKLGQIQVLEFGTGENCTYRGENMKTVGETTHFTYVSESGREEVVLSVLGNHNVNNAVVALAIAEKLGIKPSVAKMGLEKYQPIDKRGQVFEVKGMKIIDDTYNASPDSMKSGAGMLLAMEELKRKILVLADVMELGDVSRDCHYEVGTFLAKKPLDAVICVGVEAKAICEGIEENTEAILTRHFADKEQAITFLKDYVKEGDGILVKGSRGMHMEEVVEALKGLE
ncbi:MAG: UDP-N-acetylmuramoyl-tripeptide--D-alanyl-D-alanine ligase [Lachnospiraceae bacterium]|nr:UDP-N-acetylmuramoyl-tripeptide--D-alanyl-D-alanine ligase [Lachnospiraceae bacterium]